MARYDIVCVHTIVGYAPAHAAHFSTHADGAIDQSRDTAYRSAANLEGNHRVIAIENEDHGPAFGGTPSLPRWVPLTDAQVEACAQILAWAHNVHGIPLQLCPDSRPGSRGLAYHRQGIDGNFGPAPLPDGRVAGRRDVVHEPRESARPTSASTNCPRSSPAHIEREPELTGGHRHYGRQHEGLLGPEVRRLEAPRPGRT